MLHQMIVSYATVTTSICHRSVNYYNTSTNACTITTRLTCANVHADFIQGRILFHSTKTSMRVLFEGGYYFIQQRLPCRFYLRAGTNQRAGTNRGNTVC